MKTQTYIYPSQALGKESKEYPNRVIMKTMSLASDASTLSESFMDLSIGNARGLLIKVAFSDSSIC
jgi:hypothetical protein